MRALHPGLFLLVFFLLSGCATTKAGTGSIILETEDYIVLPVYYGTNRNYTGDKGSPRYYGYKYSTTVDMGMCMVSIPKEHKPGETESPLMRR